MLNLFISVGFFICIFFTNAGHFYVFVVLPKFFTVGSSLPVLSVSETCHDPVITGRLNYDLTIIHCLFVWDNHTSIVTVFLYVWQMLEVWSPMPRT